MFDQLIELVLVPVRTLIVPVGLGLLDVTLELSDKLLVVAVFRLVNRLTGSTARRPPHPRDPDNAPRLARITRLLRRRQRAEIARDVLANRGKYAFLITALMAMVVLCSATVMVLQFESSSTESGFEAGWDAFWYSVVTITTVGYGDYYPVTAGGRIAAMFIMVAGIGVIVL
jgi:hypothetical protein